MTDEPANSTPPPVISKEVADAPPLPKDAGPSPIPVAIRLPPTGDVVRVGLVMISLVAVAILAWLIADVLLLTFAAIIVAVLLRGFGLWIVRMTRVPVGVGLTLAIILIALLATGFAYVLGNELVAQTTALVDEFPTLLNDLGTRIGIPDLGDRVVPRFEEWLAQPGLVENVLGLTTGLIGVVANLIIALSVGIYLAFRPELYADGLLRLIPPGPRARFAVAFEKAGRGLHQWLRAQLLSMLIVGVLTTVGLMAIGTPSALTLGVIAGVLEFIPYVGPFLSAVPAILVGLGEGGSMVIWVALVYLVVQQLEGNVITPLVQQRATELPPVVVILSLAALGATFGPMGILLAIPITVVGMVLVNQLYLHDTLHETSTAPTKAAAERLSRKARRAARKTGA